MVFDLNVNNIGHEKINKWFQVPLTSLFKKNRFVLIFEREGERETWIGERNIDQLPPVCTLTRD